ncbi:MAG TPA: MBOAT family O-acyltransferase [Ferruginibacter sp.]|nr:MBOAT family O-acyltransferase [Ferruginibacter sp.]HMP20672.1 MBOAT family O-acyltransferase [Ferruginibacter sp.]
MVFNSYTFIVFFALVLTLHYLPLAWKTKKINLLLASYLFYAAWNPPFIILLWLSTVIDYVVGKKMYTETHVAKRRLLLFISLAGNLGLLAFFKYGGFLLQNFTGLCQLAGIDFQAAKPDIILPVGISFYTFQTLSYTLDIYLRRSEPEKSLLDFSLFVTFFPQLVAGPIVRPGQLIPQFKQPHTATREQMLQGLFLLSLGLFMKVVLADSLLAGPANSMFGSNQLPSTVDAWAGVLAFSGQIFCDFAGYSTCAIGIALCLGFTLPDNFLYPYAATGFSDFWRRWHITLSSWLRDYLYIPLGGNRKGHARTYINLMLTMLLGGLWHGANWTFVVWGGLHGFYLWIEKFIDDKTGLVKNMVQSGKKTIAAFTYALFTFFLINITWVFFRASDFASASKVLKGMFGLHKGEAILTTLDLIKAFTIIAGIFIVHWLLRNSKVLTVAYKAPWWVIGIVWALLLLLLIWSQESTSSFIYFQF